MIDWSNTITKGLLICYTGADKLCRNLVTGQKPESTVGRGFVATKYGVFPDLDNSSVGTNSTADSAIKYFKNIGFNTSAKNSVFTAMTFATIDIDSDVDITNYLTDRSDTSNNWSFQLVARAANLGSANGKAQLTSWDGTSERTFYSTTTLTGSDPYVMIGRYLGDGTNPCVDLWINGGKETAFTGSTVDGTGFTINKTSTSYMSCGSYYNFAGQYSATGTHLISAYWNRLLTDLEIQSLSKEPFQLLKTSTNLLIPGIRSEDIEEPSLITRIK